MKLANITTVYRSHLISDTYKNWLKPKHSVLDIGCGTGIVASELHKELGITISGCDIDKYLLVRMPFKKMADFDKLPKYAKKFDACMFNDMLHHTTYENQIKLLKQASKISNIVLLFELKTTLTGRIADFFINKIHNPRMNIPYTYREPEEWIKIFKKLKLKYEVKEVIKPFWYPFSHIAFKIRKK